MEKSKVIEKLSLHIVIYSYLLITLAFFVSKKKKDKGPALLGVYGILFFVLLTVQTNVRLHKDMTFYLQILYTTLEYFTFSFFFWYNAQQVRHKRFIVTCSLLFLAFQVIYVNISELKKLDSVPIGIETILLFIYIFIFFYEFSKKLSGDYIYNHYCFWLAVGILLYLGGSFFFYIMINHLSKEEINTFGNITYLVEVLKNVLFITAIFIYNRYPINNVKKKPLSVPKLDMI